MGSVDPGATVIGSIEEARDPSGARVIKLRGEIDISNADSIGQTFERLVSRAEGAAVVIDLSSLEFMDSSGIAMLLRSIGDRRSVAIRNPSSVVRRIIECTGLTDVLRFEA